MPILVTVVIPLRIRGRVPLPELIYHAGFDRGLVPLLDALPLGSLELTQAEPMLGNADQKVEILQPPGLRITVERTEETADPNLPAKDIKDDRYVGAVVHPFPSDVAFFSIRVVFEAPEWTESVVDQKYHWAPAVFARLGDVPYWPRRDERITVTLQSKREGGVLSAQMNTPVGPTLGGTSGAGKAIPEQLRQGIFASNDAERSRFTLELLVDRPGKIARAALEVRTLEDIVWSERRWFSHPLLTGGGPIESVGFAVAIADGLGTASAIVRDVHIYRYSFLEILPLRLNALFSSKTITLGCLFGFIALIILLLVL